MKDEVKVEDNNNNVAKENHAVALFYKEKKIRVHLVLKNFRFYNGDISEVTDTILILNDIKIGLVPIKLSDIQFIENYQPKDTTFPE